MSTSYAIPKLMPLRAYSAYDPMLYPDSDGQPMADNDQQYQTMVDTRFALQQKLRDQDAYVGANLLIYFQEGDPTKSIAPDVFVALDVPPGRRRTFLTWLEGQPPNVVLEIAWPRTWRSELTWKKGLYLGLGNVAGRRGLTLINSDSVSARQLTTRDQSDRPPLRACPPRLHAHDRSCTRILSKTMPLPTARADPMAFACAAPARASRCASSHSAARYTRC